MRVNSTRWKSRLAVVLGLNDGAGPPLARTTTEAERIECENLALELPIHERGKVAICTGSRTSFEAIAEAAKRLGFAAHWQSVRSEIANSVFDAVIHDGWEQADLPTAAPRILLLHFPRGADGARAQKMGISAVVAQPMLLGDLAEALSGVTR